MRKKIALGLLIYLSVAIGEGFSWGFWAHPRINRMAVFCLPEGMFAFYKANIEFLSRHAVKPDERRYAVDFEAPRHYIDLDHYGTLPFKDFPRKWEDAVKKYSEDTLISHGIVPWHVQREYYRLVKAFQNKDAESILKISAEIGHYIADAHVPLHTSENYNGQLTGQKGIHGFWESRLPELFGEEYDYFLGQAYFIKNPLEEIWKVVIESHTALDSVLRFEKELTQKFPEDLKYSYENRNNVLVRVYSQPFAKAYHESLSGQVERRIRMSILRVASFWYSAWVEAGQPNLDELAQKKIEIQEERFDKILKNFIDREAYLIPILEQFWGCCHGNAPDYAFYLDRIQKANLWEKPYVLLESLLLTQESFVLCKSKPFRYNPRF
jgi:hypothetical protein